MKITFANFEEGDTLYVVYKDLKDNYKIAKATVTGFTHWTYHGGDRWGDDEYEKPQTNINYEFENVEFSRNLEYCLNDTHFCDSVKYQCEYSHVMSDNFVEVFTTYAEAKRYILDTLSYFIEGKNEQIEKLQEELNHYRNNYEETIKTEWI